ncbi:hypothetical protein AgCh_029507 [Apium graveolens]
MYCGVKATARDGSAGHSFTRSPWEHTMQGHEHAFTGSISQYTYQGFGQTSQGHGFTGSPMEHTSQGCGSTGSHMEHTYQGFGQSTQDFHERGFQPLMSHDTSRSRYASPIVNEDDDGDDEEPLDVQVRQQPPER